MKLTSTSFDNGAKIPTEFAFGQWNENSNEESKVTLCPNKNPQFAWSGFPSETKSFAIVCVDPDVPSKPDDVNQEGKTVSKDLPRVDFYHWVMVDIPADQTEIPAGEYCDGITAKGKPQNMSLKGCRHGLNNYTQWFEGDSEMGGQYFGYDGPCPPWNDELLHHYNFTLYALDVEKLNVDGEFTAPDALQAMEGHILAESTWSGTYAINPSVK